MILIQLGIMDLNFLQYYFLKKVFQHIRATKFKTTNKNISIINRSLSGKVLKYCSNLHQCFLHIAYN